MQSSLTVSVPTGDPSLLSLDELRAVAGVSDGLQDGPLRAVADMVDDALARACGLAEAPPIPPTFRVETLTETMRGCSAAPYLMLARRPVLAVVSLTIDGTELDATEYELGAAAGVLYRLQSDVRTAWSFDKATIVYQAGWETVPPALKLAATTVFRAFWYESAPAQSSRNLKRSRIEGVGEEEYWVPSASDPLLSREITDLLGPFREVTI